MKKLLNKKGFTMAELLIVVAIIAVLVAISIPIFSAQLEKSRDATDTANLRSAYAEVVANQLAGDGTATSPTVVQKGTDATNSGISELNKNDDFSVAAPTTAGTSWTVSWDNTESTVKATKP